MNVEPDDILAARSLLGDSSPGLVAKIEGLCSLAGRPIAGTEAVRSRLGLSPAIVSQARGCRRDCR